MLDTSLKYGWDRKSGGIFYEGEFAGRVTNPNKEWWPQVECLNALLLMHDLVGQKDASYWDLFCRQWRFITDCMVDTEYGGLYQKVSSDGKTVLKDTKASKWKCCYHDGRSLLRVADRLNRLAKA
jgi:mannobiose 2-epimerase